MLAAIASSVVSQGVAMAIGMQDKFSWKQVAIAAVGSLIGSGIGATDTWVTASQTVDAVAKAVVGNALTQGVSVVIGAQDKFSWRSVAAAGVTAAINAQFAPNSTGDKALDQHNADMAARKPLTWQDFGKDLGQNFLTGAASQLISTGKLEWKQLAADAFGNAIGNSMTHAIRRNSLEVADEALRKAGVAGDKAQRTNMLNNMREQGQISAEQYQQGLADIESGVFNPNIQTQADLGNFTNSAGEVEQIQAIAAADGKGIQLRQGLVDAAASSSAGGALLHGIILEETYDSLLSHLGANQAGNDQGAAYARSVLSTLGEIPDAAYQYAANINGQWQSFVGDTNSAGIVANALYTDERIAADYHDERGNFNTIGAQFFTRIEAIAGYLPSPLAMQFGASIGASGTLLKMGADITQLAGTSIMASNHAIRAYKAEHPIL